MSAKFQLEVVNRQGVEFSKLLGNLSGGSEKISTKFVILTLLDVIQHYWTLLSFPYTLLGAIVTHLSVSQDVLAQYRRAGLLNGSL